MDKLRFETKSGAEMNIERIATLFPEVVTESRDKDGKLVKAVNWDTLKSLLGDVVEGRAESYDFTWVGKREALMEAGAPIRKTLRPVKADSVNWDTTQNLYIEGDNLDVLKLLTDSYLGKVKMIYIDPPYNTGHDFVYSDKFTMDEGDYDEGTERIDEDGNINFRENLVTNPRFHSDWCSMIYPRLKVARNLLTDDGVIFISIDDNEQANMKKICDEIFGAHNFVAEIAWQCLDTIKNDAKYFSDNHEYILVYAKQIENVDIQGIKKGEKQRNYYKNQDGDPRGDYLLTPLHAKSGTEAGIYSFTFSNGQTWTPPKGTYPRFSQATLKTLDEEGRLYLDPNGINTPQKKTYLSEVGDRMPPVTFWDYASFGSTRQSNKELAELIEKGMFQNPKPTKTIATLLDLLVDTQDAIVVDFFSGSATTAHAVMQLNADDSGSRKFIMVQLPEATDEKSEAYKAGYKNICEIGKERIRRAGQKIADENRMLCPDLDIGFRVFKLDESNFKDVHFSAGQLSEMSLFDTLAENLKEDRTAEDLLYSCILEWGLSLSLPHTEETIEGKKVFVVNGGDLIACFEKDLPESVIKAIAGRKPLNALFRESCFADSPAKINNEEIFKLLSPSTKVKVL